MRISPDVLTELIHRVGTSNDQKAFEKLYHTYSQWLFATALAIVKNRETSEEIVVDVFQKIWQMRAQLPKIANFESYLYVSVKNLSFDYLRKSSKYKWSDLKDLSPLTDSDNPEKSLLLHELTRKIETAVKNLPERCRLVFELIRMEQKSYKEVAAELQISTKTVENQMTIAIKKIMKEMESYLQDHHMR